MVKRLFDVAHKVGVVGLISMTSAPRRLAPPRVGRASGRARKRAAPRRFFGIYTCADGFTHVVRHRKAAEEKMVREGTPLPPPPKHEKYFS